MPKPTLHKARFAGEDKTESIASDTPDPSSSGYFSRMHCVRLKTTFPSIYASMELMHRHYEAKDVSALRATALVFLTTYRTVIAETAKMRGLDSTDINLHVCRASTTSIGKLFENHINNLEELSRIDTEALTAAFRFAKMALSTLEHLHQLSVLTSRDKKCLPAIPVEDDASIYHDALSEFHSPASCEVVPLPPSITASTSLASSSTSTQVGSEATASTPNKISPMSLTARELEEDNENVSGPPPKGGLTQRLKQKIAHCPKVPLFNNKNKSTVTLSEPQKQPAIPSYMMEDEDCIDDDFIITRRSTIYFPNDPRFKNTQLLYIQPTSIAGSVCFDSKGKIRAGTLDGLIRVLTSSEGITNTDLLNTIMSNFRVFSTPQVFLSRLMARYDERPLHAFDSVEIEQWECEFHAVRVRVVKIILLWLKEHWNQEQDVSTLPEIKAFVETRTPKIPDNLTALLHQEIAAIEHGTPSATNVASSKKAELHSPTKFKFPNNKQTCNLSIQLLAYNSSNGRHEFARQITAKVAEMYIRIEPNTMVTYWNLKPDQKKALEQQPNLESALRLVLDIRDFEEALVMWVSYTIVKQYDSQERIDFITFWLDIALQCLEILNFSSASCIFTGVAHYSIGAMKATILHVPRRVKAIFHHLERFFSGHGNYSLARSAMNGSNTDTKPMVPLLAPLRHDVGVCQEIPKIVNQKKNGQDIQLINLQGYEIMTKTMQSLSYQAPYNIQQNRDFQTWLDSQLVRFSDNSQIAELYNGLYRRSRKREPKNSTLKEITDPWLYIVEGNEQIGPLDPADLAALVTTSNSGKGKSILQSLRSRGMRDRK